MLGLCPCLGRSYNDEQMQKKRAKSRKRRRRRRVLRERGNWPGSSSSTTSRHFWLALMMMTFSTTMALASEPIRGEQTTWIFLSQTCLPSWTIQSADQMVSAAQTGRTLGKTSEGGAAATAVGGYRASDRISRGRDTLINETYPLSPASSRPFCLFFSLVCTISNHPPFSSAPSSVLSVVLIGNHQEMATRHLPSQNGTSESFSPLGSCIYDNFILAVFHNKYCALPRCRLA